MSLKRVLLFSLCILVLSGLVGCRETEITVKSELCAQIRASIQGTAAQPGTGRENSGTGRSGAAFTACSDAAAAD